MGGRARAPTEILANTRAGNNFRPLWPEKLINVAFSEGCFLNVVFAWLDLRPLELLAEDVYVTMIPVKPVAKNLCLLYATITAYRLCPNREGLLYAIPGYG